MICPLCNNTMGPNLSVWLYRVDICVFCYRSWITLWWPRDRKLLKAVKTKLKDIRRQKQLDAIQQGARQRQRAYDQWKLL